MSFANHINPQTKRGCIIVTSDPQTGEIEAKIQRGEIIPIHAYTYTPLFRWPMVGEKWIIREENGSWFLESIIEEQEPTPHTGEATARISSELVLKVRFNPRKQ